MQEPAMRASMTTVIELARMAGSCIFTYYIERKSTILVFLMRNPLKYIILLALATGFAAPAAGQEPPGGDYTVQPGDILEISVWKEVDLQREVLVRPDGRFSFPLAGEVDATGKTVGDLRDEIASSLQKYIPDLIVTVSVKSILGNKVYVLGQVNKPGEFVVNPRVDVMQALSMAGGTTPFAALNDIVVLRRDGNGSQRAIRFAYKDVERGRSLDQNIVLNSGDVVVVP
jgi:polysaccharide export outer membrane protein